MRGRVKPQVVYHAFGGGMGHATRAAAILRQLRRLGYESLLALTNARLPLPFEREGIPFLHFTDNAPDVLRVQVPQAIVALAPQVLVVDVFPHGIVGELTDVLASLSCRKVLVYRHVQEPFAAQAREAMSHFDCALLAEEPPTPLPCPAVPCCPLLLRNADELLPRAAAKTRLGVAEDETVVLGVSSESEEWTEDFFALLDKIWRRLKPQAQLRFAALPSPPAPLPQGGRGEFVSHYPLIELFNGVDVVVGASGYHLFHEAQACGVEAIFLPQPRRYDDQFWRARNARVARGPEELERLLYETLETCRLKPLTAAQFTNGCRAAAQAMAQWLKPERPCALTRDSLPETYSPPKSYRTDGTPRIFPS